MKLVILIIASDNNPIYREHQEVWKKYMNSRKEIKSFFIFGDPNIKKPVLENGDKLLIKCEESYIPGIFQKSIRAIKYINRKYQYDFLIRTNLSSFYIYDNLLPYLENQNPNLELFAGKRTKSKMSPDNFFISGAGILFSKRSVQTLIKESRKLKPDMTKSLPDDLIISYLMKSVGQTNIPFQVVHKMDQMKQIGKQFHIRVRMLNGREKEVVLLKELLKRYY